MTSAQHTVTQSVHDAGVDLIRGQDPQVAAILDAEAERQATTIELIASENHASPAVMAAAGSCMTNKYAEGYPSARYYGGCVHHDAVEQLAIDRATELFGCNYANVQPHSGQRRRVPRVTEARRYVRFARARGRRSPEPRAEGQHERQVVQPRALPVAL